MITIKHHSSIDRSAVQSIAWFVPENDQSVITLAHEYADGFSADALKAYSKQTGFSGQAGKILALPITSQGNLITLFFIGLGGKREHYSIEQMRRACGLLMKSLQQRGIASCALVVPDAALFGSSVWHVAEQATIALEMAAYRFDDYITDEGRKVIKDLQITFIALEGNAQELQKGIHDGSIIAQAVNQTRHWVDLPPSALNPSVLAKRAEDVAQQEHLACTVFGEPEIKSMGMGGLAAVSAGSHEDCKLIILEYKTTKKDAPTIAFVGKGITFDSGGLSLKPATAMETMKDDMSGAAAVINVMQALARLKPEVNVIGLAPTSENLPSGTATKPGDIIRFYNGKTAEVKNTDAEGRLILADALSYAVKHYKLDAIIDIATLTGACAHALGPFFSGMMGKHEWLLQALEKAAHHTGDRVWRLPFDDDYKKAIISDAADICNIGKSSYKAGAITAGFFLQHFVGTVPWVHIDIAGTAFDVPDMSYYVPGATGAGVRLLIALAMQWQHARS